MFKNLVLYRFTVECALQLPATRDAMAAIAFAPCGATQEKSTGFVPPRGEEHGAIVEAIGGQWIASVMTETRSVPVDALQRRVDEMADAIEKQTGRKPGKKERRELAEEARLDLLPRAFTKRRRTFVWIDPFTSLLAIDASTQIQADGVASLLAEALPGIAMSLIDTKTSQQAAMAHWLKEQEPPVGFSIDRECELKASDESKAVVKYGRHHLDIAEVKQHIQAGKRPTRLALTWDERVSFLLTEGLQLKKISFLDSVFEGQDSTDNGFDADVAIATGELSKLIPDLISALGGECCVLLGRAEASADAVDTKAPAGHHYTDGHDPLYDQAVALVLKERKASISYVQRHLRIGYNRAAQLLEDMEKAGIVSHMGAYGARKVTA